MLEIFGNIWDKYEAGYPVCVTTNGFVKSNGCAVMGCGIARQAAEHFPNLPKLVGSHILDKGWEDVWEVLPNIIIFPVKRAKLNNTPGWALAAELSIITTSLSRLSALRLTKGFNVVILPRPGCGAGRLAWSQVKPLCDIYEDWLHIITY
jgi:hypothetical protein